MNTRLTRNHGLWSSLTHHSTNMFLSYKYVPRHHAKAHIFLELCPWLNGAIAMKMKSCAVLEIGAGSMEVELNKSVNEVQYKGEGWEGNNVQYWHLSWRTIACSTWVRGWEYRIGDTWNCKSCIIQGVIWPI